MKWSGGDLYLYWFDKPWDLAGAGDNEGLEAQEAHVMAGFLSLAAWQLKSIAAQEKERSLSYDI